MLTELFIKYCLCELATNQNLSWCWSTNQISRPPDGRESHGLDRFCVRPYSVIRAWTSGYHSGHRHSCGLANSKFSGAFIFNIFRIPLLTPYFETWTCSYALLRLNNPITYFLCVLVLCVLCTQVNMMFVMLLWKVSLATVWMHTQSNITNITLLLITQAVIYLWYAHSLHTNLLSNELHFLIITLTIVFEINK
jgi:hypothetical protein